MLCWGAHTDIHPRPSIPPRVMALSAMGLKLGVFDFSAYHASKQTQNQCIQKLNTLCVDLRVFYLHARTTVDAVTYSPHEPWSFDYKKNPNTPNLTSLPGER